MTNDVKPRQIRTERRTAPEINEGWYYEGPQGLELVIELRNPTRQLLAGVIPWRNIEAALKRRAAHGEPR